MMPDDLTAPLPVLSGAPTHLALPHNDWRLLVESVPLHFAPPMYQTPLVATKQVPAVPASPFRTGELRFGADGIEIEGMAVLTPPKWYALLSSFSVLPYFFMQFVGRSGRRLGIPIGFRIAFILFFLSFAFVPWGLQRWLDKRRAETKLVLGWDSLRAVQVDTKLRSVTLVYSSFAVPQIIKAIRWLGTTPASIEALNWHHLTLNKLEPSVVQGVADTLAHFAPHAVHERVDAKRNLLWSNLLVRVLMIILLVVLVAAFAAIFIAAYRRRHP